MSGMWPLSCITTNVLTLLCKLYHEHDRLFLFDVRLPSSGQGAHVSTCIPSRLPSGPIIFHSSSQRPSTNSSSTPQFRYPFQRFYFPPPSLRHYSRPSSRPRSDLIPFIPTRNIVTVPSSRFDDIVLPFPLAFIPPVTMYRI